MFWVFAKVFEHLLSKCPIQEDHWSDLWSTQSVKRVYCVDLIMSRTVLATSIFVIGLSAYFILSKRVSVKQQVKDCADSVVKRENQNQASDETESISDSS